MKTLFVPWLLVACNFPHDNPNRGVSTTWIARGGIRLKGSVVPYGRSTLR